MIQKELLISLYCKRKKSSSEIADHLKCSASTVNYWLKKHNIKKRLISEAVYIKHNPSGDPFHFCEPKNNNEWFLYGLGLGLFWGEGNKVNKHSVRLGNTDPDLIWAFLQFLTHIYRVDKSRLRFDVQIFQILNRVMH